MAPDRAWIVGLALAYAMPGRMCAEPADATAESANAEGVTDNEFRLPVNAELRQRISLLIQQLGAPDYRAREQAAIELSVEIGAPAFALLREAYASTDDLEVRLRIEGIVLDAYLDHHVLKRTAFLGIGPKPGLRTSDADSRLPPGRVGIVLDRIIPGSAAEQAGLQPNDVILALDGQPIGGPQVPGFEAFAEAIRAAGPGATITLSVVRVRHVFALPVTLGHLPRDNVRLFRPTRELYLRTMGNFSVWWKRYFRNGPEASPGD